VVKCDGCSREIGAVLPCVVANGEDVVELPALKLVDVLGTVPGDVNAELTHYSNRLRANLAGVRAGAEDFEAIAGILAQ